MKTLKIKGQYRALIVITTLQMKGLLFLLLFCFSLSAGQIEKDNISEGLKIVAKAPFKVTKCVAR